VLTDAGGLGDDHQVGVQIQDRGAGVAKTSEPDPAAAPALVRPVARRPRANPAGSTAKVRGEVLTALGMLKVVTADQLWPLLRPEAKENKFARAALNDLQSAKLVHSEGRTSAGHKTWGLTPAGRDAAQQVMPAGREVGNIARGAGRSGAPHAMAVNETILAFTTGGTGEGAGPGMGTVLSWTTEVVHEAPSKRRAQADAVLRAPEYGLPVLLVEVDRATEAAHILAGKFERHAAYFAHQVKVTDPDAHTRAAKLVPAWQLTCPDPVRPGYPPIAVVLTGGSDTVLRSRAKALLELARPWWQGDTRFDGFTDYATAIPILVATLARLQQRGHLGAVWWRLGHSGFQSLDQALENPDDRAAFRARQAAEAEAERLAMEREEREASRCPVCRRASDTAPRRVLARQAAAWVKELHTAWAARQEPAQHSAPPVTPAPQSRPAPRGGVRSPAARTALQQLLADLEAERVGQPALSAVEVPPSAPRRA
jgi:hypothetical protein